MNCGRFACAGTWAQFGDAIAAALVRPGLDVVEIRTQRNRNVELHRRVWPAVAAAIRAS